MAKIVLYCQPGAKQTQLIGRHDGKPKIQLQAAPVDGEANKVLIHFLAGLCQVPKAAVQIIAGASSRTKRVEIQGVSDEQLQRLLGAPPPS